MKNPYYSNTNKYSYKTYTFNKKNVYSNKNNIYSNNNSFYNDGKFEGMLIQENRYPILTEDRLQIEI